MTSYPTYFRTTPVLFKLLLFVATVLALLLFSTSTTFAATAQDVCTANSGILADNGNGTFTCTTNTGGTESVTQVLNGDGSVVSTTGGSGGVGGVSLDANGKPVTSPADCESTMGYIGSFGTCLIRTVTTSAAAFLISIAVTIMEMVGWLFNIAISQTVIGFNAWLSGSVLTAITTGWTFFRDIANIVIIGLFVFIAINLILGNKSYGDRKLIARVLIVAVLINFSFLFTRIVINFSNAVAVQFAKIQPLDAQATQFGATPPDIAGKFTDLMGVKSWSNTKDTLQDIAKNQNSIWLALMHALIVVIIALGVAIVLFYGAILLLIRALIFIFLLVTSSLAFATYLLPNLASSDFGWKAWWTALFRNAVLAPLMMLFLAITLQISQGLVTSLNGGSSGNVGNIGVLGALGTNPDASNVSALVIYIIILGLLYGAISISNRFSGAAGQFAWAGTLPFANASVAWPSRSLGFLSRNTIGRGAERLSENLSKKASMADGVQRSIISRWALNLGAQAGKRVAKSDFNVGNATGIKSAQTKLGGFTGQEKRRTDRLKEQSTQMTMDNKKVEELLKQNRQTAAQEIAGEKATKQTEMENAAKALKDAAEAQKKAEEQKQNLEKDINNLANKIKEVKDKGINATEKEKLDVASDEETLKRKRIESEAQSRIIEKAKQDAQAHASQSDAAKDAIAALEKRAEQRARDMMPSNTINKETGKVIPKGERIADTAKELGHQRISNFVPRQSGLNNIDTDAFANRVRSAVSKDTHHEESNKAIKDAVKEFSKQLEHAGDHVEHAAEKAHEDADKQKDILKDIKRNTSH